MAKIRTGMRNKVTTRDGYMYYRKGHEDSLKGLTRYFTVINGLMRHIMDEVHNGHRVHLGARLGEVFISGRKIEPRIGKDGKIKGAAPNWGKTKKVWVEVAKGMGLTFEEYIAQVPREQRPDLVYCLNEHTNGIQYNITWARAGMIARHRTLYNLRFSRENKLRVNKLAHSGEAEYIDSIHEVKKLTY